MELTQQVSDTGGIRGILWRGGGGSHRSNYHDSHCTHSTVVVIFRQFLQLPRQNHHPIKLFWSKFKGGRDAPLHSTATAAPYSTRLRGSLIPISSMRLTDSTNRSGEIDAISLGRRCHLTTPGGRERIWHDLS